MMMNQKELEADKYEALAVPAISVNRFFILGASGVFRIVLGEKFDKEPTNYHAAFNVNLQNASELVTTLQSLIAMHATPASPTETKQ